MTANTEVWVNDRLHDILGISDTYIAQYFVGLAKKSESSSELVERLKETGTVDVDDRLISFAKDLFDKVWFCKHTQYFFYSKLQG